MTAMDPAPRPARRRLPAPLVVLAILMLLKALLILAIAAGATLSYLQPVIEGGPVSDTLEEIGGVAITTTTLAITAVLIVLSVVGLLLRRRGGWLLAMVLTGIFIAIDIYNWFNGGANHFWMVLNIVSVFYLNQQEVREVVGAATDAGPDGARGEGVPA